MTATVETLDRASASVADIALRFPHAIDILNKYHLDYCCNGKKRFDDVCKRNDLDPEQIWQEVQRTNGSSADKPDRFDSWNLTLLIDYIIMNHHQYVQEMIPEIKVLLNKVCNAHGEDQPFLLTVREKFNSLSEELLAHMPKEEQLLFPAIKRIEQNVQNGKDSPSSSDNLTIPIMVMEHEHETAGDLVKSIRSLTNNFMPPAFACPTFLITYKFLQEFDDDLMQHIHLENNILFPKAKKLTEN